MFKYISVFFVSMVPLIELRGAIPYAYVYKAADPNFNLLLAYILIAVGNMLPMPFIYFFARKVLEWGKDKPVIGGFFTFCLEKGEKGGQKLQEKAGRGLFLALLLFVGIPVPGTGARRRRSCPRTECAGAPCPGPRRCTTSGRAPSCSSWGAE